jgi:alpha-glucosidase (family GH31 glycosyl hydrolase)
MGSARVRSTLVALALVVAGAAAPAAGAATQDRAATVETAQGRVVVSRSPFRLTFTDRAGRQVLTEHLSEQSSARRSLRVAPPPPPLAASYGPPLQETLYAPLAFTVGTETTTTQERGTWAGNLLTSVRTGTVYRARAVRSTRRTPDGGVRLVVSTTDPSGRLLVVTVGPDRGGALHVRVRPSPSTGVVGMSDSFEAPAREAFHGFGGVHSGIDQRGASFYGWAAEESVDAAPFDVPGSESGTLLYPNGPQAAYYPQSSFVSSEGYGFLLDRPELARWRLAAPDEPRAWQADVAARQLDYVVTPGPAPRAIRTLTAITGRQPVPPAWAVGPTLDRATALGETAASYEAKVRQDLRDIDRYHLPLRAYRIEGWGILPAATVRELIGELHRRGIRALVYFRAFVSDDVAGTETAGLYDVAIKRGLVARTAAGEPYTFGNSFGGTSVLLDFTNPATRAWWAQRLQAVLDLGADGFMQDFGEEVMPAMRFHDGRRGLAMHNRYATIYDRTTRHVLDAYERAHPGRRIFFFTRAGGLGRPGSAAYEGGNFPGDETTDWTRSSGIASVIPDMLNRAVGGAFGFSTDIGGYLDLNSPATTKELFLRWAELTALTPFFRLHGSLLAGTHTPWRYDTETVRIYKRLTRLHQRAERLILRLWHTGTRTGMPPTRPLWLAAPGDARAAREDQAWMLGNDLLVAPVVQQGATSRRVVLPRGCWRRAGTGAALRGPAVRTVSATLGVLPWFTRCGTRPLASS